jgi:alkylhydroperoxidase/carboxymuconolactone decarboxylase family protein YurZ
MEKVSDTQYGTAVHGQEELVEAITHLAFYAGWPSAFTAISVTKELFEKK